MNTISMELHQEQITELQSQIEELESEKSCLVEELEDIKSEYGALENNRTQKRYMIFRNSIVNLSKTTKQLIEISSS